MAAAVHPLPHFGLRAARQALLVIHGIGEQNPYETLDSFARGVFTYLYDTRHLNAKLCPIEFAHKDWTQVGMRIGIFEPGQQPPECPVKDGPPKPGAPATAEDEHKDKKARPLHETHVDIFEYYWAPETEDKLSAVQTVKWVLFTDLTPLKYFADNLQQMIVAQGMSRAKAFGRALKLYVGELLRIVFLYLTLGLGMVWLLGWLSKPHSWGAALKTLATALGPHLTWTQGFILFFYALFLLMAWFGWQGLWELKQHPGAAIETIGDRVWLWLDGLAAALFLGAALALDLRPGRYVAWHALSRVFGNGHWQPLAGAAIAWIVS